MPTALLTDFYKLSMPICKSMSSLPPAELGIFRKLVTGPLWRVLESRDVSIIDMSVKYQSLVAYFQQ